MQQDDIILSTVVSFLSLDDLPSVARTCKQWNRLSGFVCHEWMKKNCAALEKLVKYLPAESCNWKRVVQSRHQPPTVESSLNVQLQRDFDTLFRPAGIAAYSIEGTAAHNLFDRRISIKKKIYFPFVSMTWTSIGAGTKACRDLLLSTTEIFNTSWRIGVRRAA